MSKHRIALWGLCIAVVLMLIISINHTPALSDEAAAQASEAATMAATTATTLAATVAATPVPVMLRTAMGR